MPEEVQGSWLTEGAIKKRQTREDSKAACATLGRMDATVGRMDATVGRLERVRCKSRKWIGKMSVSVDVGGLPALEKWSAHVSGCLPSHHVTSVILSSGREVYGTVLTRFGFAWCLPRALEAEGLLPSKH